MPPVRHRSNQRARLPLAPDTAVARSNRSVDVISACTTS